MLNKISINYSKQKLIVYIVLVLATLSVYCQVNGFDFLNYDDPVYVTENNDIASGITLDGFIWAFLTTYAEFWHPLTWLSLMLDYQLFGLNAGGYHVTNLILHVLSTLMLFWLFNRMTKEIWPSAFVAALFAIHPLHVESVAWVSERKDVLSAFFWMLTLCLYVYYTEKPVIRRYLLVLFSFVLALMSKPMVVTLPVIMILLDYWPLKRFALRRDLFLWQFKEKTIFFILSAVFSVIAFLAQHDPTVKNFSLTARLTNAPVSFVTYLEKTFWPHVLAISYPFSDQLPGSQVLGGSLLILVISTAVFIAVKRLPYLFVGWLWYAITILPVIGIIQINLDAMNDHYTYLPLIGIGIMLAWGIPLLFPSEYMRKKILFPAGIAVMTIMAVLSWQQCRYWKNNITIFNHTLQVTKDNGLAHICMGRTLLTEGKIEEAIDHFNKAIHLGPYCHEVCVAYNSRGFAYYKLGQYQRAIEDFDKVIRLRPNCHDVCVAYNNRGFAYYKLGQYQRAIEDFDKAIRLRPNFTDAYNNRGVAYFYQGNNYELGCRDAQKACELRDCELLELAKGKGYCR